MSDLFEEFVSSGAVAPDTVIFVAEISANHGQSKERAMRLVEAAKTAGADAIKLQTYTADSMTLNSEDVAFRVSDWTKEWNGQTSFSLYEKGHTPWNWHSEIFEYAKHLGLGAFSSPFSAESVGFLEKIDCPIYKIASYENNDLSLISAAAETGKPVIISTGASSLAEIQAAVQTALSSGAKHVSLLQCTSAYPAPHNESNVRAIPHMSSLFGLPVGFSDHTLGIGASLSAALNGAFMIEKHLKTEDETVVTLDSHFSANRVEMENMIKITKDALSALGSPVAGPTESEMPSVREKRSLYIRTSIKKGQVLGMGHISSLRPRLGLEPNQLESVIGRTLKQDVEAGTPISWDLF